MTDRPQVYLKVSAVNYKLILFGAAYGGRMFTRKEDTQSGKSQVS